MEDFRSGEEGPGRDPPKASARPRTPSSGGGLELLCREIAERARDLASRARLLGQARLGPAQEPLARLVEEDARELALLAEDAFGRCRAPPGAPQRCSLPAEVPPLAEPARPRLLVAEDDEEEREALVAALERDYEIVSVEAGEKALKVALREPPDIVLLDLHIPGMDGISVLEALRAEPGTVEVPVMFLSGRADDSTRVRALELGAADFLQKPVSTGELRARIDRTLRLTRRQTQLHALAQTDALTGLANLRAFRSRLEDEVRRAARYGTALTCVMADMDYLKPVNDEFGHAAGDRAIAAVAEVIRGELRTTDLGARYGGDEFVLLLPHTTAAEGHVLAERLCARLKATTLDAFGRQISLHASFGVAEMAGAAEPAGELVRRADDALYTAKRAGRGQVAVYFGPSRARLP